MKSDIFTLRREPLAYTEDQKIALAAVVTFLGDANRRTFVLAGYAGTGKTTILENIAAYIRKQGNECLLTAPTNRAVRILADKMPDEAGQTLHRLLYGAPDEDGNWIPHVEFEPGQVVVCDEASMIGEPAYQELSDRITAAGAKVIYVGDSFQLPPVGTDPKLLATPDVTLRQVMRQGAESNILSLATVVRTIGKKILPDSGAAGVSLVTPRAVLGSFLLNIKKDQDSVFICGKNETRIEINRQARAIKFGASVSNVPQAGDRLICIANGPNVNGETVIANTVNWTERVTVGIMVRPEGRVGGSAVKIKLPACLAGINDAKYLFFPEVDIPSVYHNQIVVDKKIFGGDWLVENRKTRRWELNKNTVNIATFAYAITAHKSQGGQWSKVYLDQDAFRNDARWFYTAITRATDEVLIARKADSSSQKMTWAQIKAAIQIQ